MNDIKKLIIICGGKIDRYTDKLHPKGVAQMEHLIIPVEHFLAKKEHFVMLSSSSPKQQVSARYLADKMNMPYQPEDAFLNDLKHTASYTVMLRTLKDYSLRKPADVIILVTHREIAESLGIYVVKDKGFEFPKQEEFLRDLDLLEGDAVFLNLQTGYYDLYRQIL